MRNDITERFIINMYVRGMKISEIANTVNITPQEVTEIIEKSKREISKKTEKIGNEDSRRLNVQVRKVNSTSKIIKEGKEEVKEKMIVSKTSKKLLEIKKKIMSGEEYDKEELKRLRNRIIIKNYRKPNRGEIEELIQIYVQLSRFTNAKAIVREIYYELPNKNDEKRIMSGIEEQELSYNIMKYLKNGMSVEQIAENLHLYTVDAIKEVNKQKELNNEIKIMHKEGKSEVDIAELLNENIQRVKWGLESKNKEQSITEKDGKRNDRLDVLFLSDFNDNRNHRESRVARTGEDCQHIGDGRRKVVDVFRIATQDAFCNLNEIVQTAGQLHRGNSRNHRRDDQDHIPGNRTRFHAEADAQDKYAQTAGVADTDTAQTDTQEDGAEQHDNLKNQHNIHSPSRFRLVVVINSLRV